MNMVSVTILSITGVIFFVGIVLFVISQLEMDHQKMVLVETDNQKKVWIERYQNGFPPFKGFPNWYSEKLKTFNNTIPESYDLKVEYLKDMGIVVYDFKHEYSPELAEMCEALSCRSGYVDSYLISKKDVPELVKLGCTVSNCQ